MRYLCFLGLLLLFGCNYKTHENEKIKPLYNYDIEEKLVSMGIELNEPKLPPGITFEMATQSNNMIYLSGNGPIATNGIKTTGKVGINLTIEEGYEASRLTAINHLSILKQKIGDLNKVVKIVKVFGMVNSDSSFVDHPKVINGYSDLLVEVFGERGKHSRSAVGMVSLPWNLACEIETIVEIREK